MHSDSCNVFNIIFGPSFHHSHSMFAPQDATIRTVCSIVSNSENRNGTSRAHRLRVKAPAVLKLPRCPLIGIQPASIQLTGHLPPNTASAQSMPNAAWLVSAMTLLATPDTYQGESYYMRYRPIDTADCYAFETRTVTDNGQVKTGDYCR